MRILFAFSSLLFLTVGGCAVMEEGEKEMEIPRVQKHKPLTCIRIYPNKYDTPEKRARILRLFDQYGKPDEVWLSTAAGPDSLSTHRKVLKSCVAMAEELRKRDIAVSIQLSSTIGHFGGKAYTKKDAFQWTQDDLLVGHNGVSKPGICCPSSPRFAQWCASVFAMYCKEIQPLTAFLDDDMRFHEHGELQQTCCCRRCLERFGKLTGRKWTVKQVHDMLESKKPQPYRRQWVELHTQIITEFYERAAREVHAVSPESYVGVQNQNAKYFYSVWNFKPIFETIKRVTGRPARVRIGGGAWNGFDPSFLVRKSFITGCDIDDAKACGAVDLLGHEEENWPCTIMNKNTHGKALEFALHLAMGGNYLTCQSGDLWEDYDSTMAEILTMFRQWDPLFLRLRDLSSKYRFDGITALVQDGIIEQPRRELFPWYVFWAVESEYLRLSSLPLRLSKRASAEGRNPGYLTAETARGISEENFKRFLRAGMVVTGNAYLELQKRGLTKDLKVKAQKCVGTRCEFLQGPHAGTQWFWGTGDAVKFTFEKDSKAEALMNYCYLHKGIAVWRLETPGGRIAVVGSPGDFNRNLSHLALDMYRDLFDWVGKQPVSVRLENAASIILIPLADENGRIRAVSIVNTGSALEKSLKLHVRRPFSDRAQWHQATEKAVDLKGVPAKDKDSYVFALPELGSWQFALLELK